MEAFDLAVLKSRIDSAAREMDANLRLSAYSSIVREAKDYSVAILDLKGEVIGQAECIPMMTAAMGRALSKFETKIDSKRLNEDSVLIFNDPFTGGQHLQDVYIFQPIFFEDQLVGFGGSAAHHVDFGGAWAGISAGATEIYGEGLRFPLTMFSLSNDWYSPNGLMKNLIRANTRSSAAVIGDINAQLAASKIARVRVIEMCREFGARRFSRGAELLKDHAEARMRDAISKVPNGTFTAEAEYDLETWGGDFGYVRAKVTVADTEILVDFDGTDEQVLANINCPLSSTISAVQSAVQAFIDVPDLSFNHGCTRPVSIEVPYGSILNPRVPAAVRARLTPASRAYTAVFSALCQADPQKTVAMGFDTTTAVTLSSVDDFGDHQMTVEVFGGGWGGCEEHDGADALDNPVSNCSNAPIEALENDYSHFYIEEYSICDDGGGAGRSNGGRGTRRVYVSKIDGTTVGGYSDRHRTGARGSFGAEDGAPGNFSVLRKDGSTERLPTVFETKLDAGEKFIMITGGGGGFGSSDRG